MSRLLTALFCIICLFASLSAAFAGDENGTAPQVRYSVTPETVRVVLDLPGQTAYLDQSTPRGLTFTLATGLAEIPAPIALTDPIVTGISLAPDLLGFAELNITLAQARKTHIFTLPAEGKKPFRLVIDVLKRFNVEERREIAPGVTYTRIEQQTDARYLAAHFLEVDTAVPGVHLGVTAAQGQRERVCTMTRRTGAICGVNGGFFLGSATAHPVGLLKVDNTILSLPIWDRTAAAFPAAGPPVLVNPHGLWHVALPDGTARDLPDSLDATGQIPPVSVVVNGNNFMQAPANPHGLTVLIRDGKVAGKPTANAALAPGEYALQLTGDDARALEAQLVDGAAVTLIPALTPDLADYPSAVGAGPRLLRDGQLEITGQAERFQPDILTGRAARTGLGITADKRVVLAVIEPPGPYGGGATLSELAELLKVHGAVDALNLDGGGSSTLAIGSQTVNYPSGTWIRPVASGVMIFATAAPSPPTPLPEERGEALAR